MGLVVLNWIYQLKYANTLSFGLLCIQVHKQYNHISLS
jgi:hypothetical protein